MADPTTDDKALDAAPRGLLREAADLKKKDDDAPKDVRDPSAEVPMVLRALLGFAGLALLVGFFFPWLHIPNEHQGQTVLSGLALLQQDTEMLAGTPPMAILVVPVLGTALAALAFMGFRYTAYVAIGVSVTLFAYAAYVFFQLFVQYTDVGLWITTGSAFLTLLLGAGTLFWMRRVADRAKARAEAKPAKA